MKVSIGVDALSAVDLCPSRFVLFYSEGVFRVVGTDSSQPSVRKLFCVH